MICIDCKLISMCGYERDSIIILISIFNLTLLYPQQSQERFTVVDTQKASSMGLLLPLNKLLVCDSLKSLYKRLFNRVSWLLA